MQPGSSYQKQAEAYGASAPPADGPPSYAPNSYGATAPPAPAGYGPPQQQQAPGYGPPQSYNSSKKGVEAQPLLYGPPQGDGGEPAPPYYDGGYNDFHEKDLEAENMTTTAPTKLSGVCCCCTMASGCAREPHLLSLVLSVIIWGCVVGSVVMVFLPDTRSVFFVPLTVAVFFYIPYMVEACCGSTGRFVSHLLSTSNASNYIDNLRSADPQLIFHAKCYHEETRTRTVTSTDANGNTTTRFETYTVEVVTHTDSMVLQMNGWEDSSRECPPLEGFELSKLFLRKRYNCKDQAAADELNGQRAAFHQAHMYCDRRRLFTEDLRINGFEPRILACVDGANVPWAVNSWVYYTFSCFGCSWPYKVWLSGCTGVVNYEVVKTFY